jgi:hypothetical protein
MRNVYWTGHPPTKILPETKKAAPRARLPYFRSERLKLSLCEPIPEAHDLPQHVEWDITGKRLAARQGYRYCARHRTSWHMRQNECG